MIYGLIAGATILIIAFTHQFIPFYFVLLGGVSCVAIVAIGNYRKTTYASSTASSTSSTSGTTPAPTPGAITTPSTPPLPAAAPKSYGWLVWLIVLATIGGLGWLAYTHLQSAALRTSAPAPRATAPKRELQKKVIRVPLVFVGGEKLTRGPGWIGIPGGKEGYANFRAYIPVLKNGKYKIHYHGGRIKEGQDHLEINRGKGNGGNSFSIEHSATDFPIELTFFDEGYAVGMTGEAKYFHPGENYFKLWADGKLMVRLDQPIYVKITYWE